MKAKALVLACALFSRHQQRSVSCEQCHGVANPSTPAKSKSCMKCHNYEDLAAKSKAKKLALNPHDSHAGQLRCTLCHHEHAQSVVYCKQCHIANDARFNFKVP